MAGRRRHPRFEVLNTNGVLRLLRDVVIRRVDSGGFIAIAHEPEPAGELVMMHRVGAHPADVLMEVVESRPVLVDGSVRHRLLLMPVDRNAKRRIDAKRRDVREAE